jgi:tetratricopeptide (TPR) repeat protein
MSCQLYCCLTISGEGIKKNQVLHGPSVLDIAPTILTLYGLSVGEDMDGRVLSQAFVKAPEVAFIPSWEAVPGADGRHPPHTRLDPVAAHEALEQMIALGYIERPDENREIAVAQTIRELRYNLGEAYQDDDRHIEAHQIFTTLRAADPDEQRFAVRLFVSCQALGMQEEMRRIVDDLDGRRRALFEVAQRRIEASRTIALERLHQNKEAGTQPESMLSDDERRELARWRNLARYQPPVIDYLKAQVLTAEKRYEEALAVLERVSEAHLVRPGLFLQTGDLYMRLRRWRDAQHVYEKALAIDPDNAHAHIGLCRMALLRRKFSVAAQSALDALQRVYHYPLAHFLLGRALTGLKEYKQAADAFRAAISVNPNFPEAHVLLAALLEKHLGNPESAREHRRLARRMRVPGTTRPWLTERIESPDAVPPLAPPLPARMTEMPPLEEYLIVVTGLPRSGTSMLMQMLAAGGMDVLSDGLRVADEDNPRGYLEFEPVKHLLKDSQWLFEGRGKVIKILVPVLAALPPDLDCRVILIDRNLEEVLDSQQRMLVRRNQLLAATPERRRVLREEYVRTLDRVKEMLRRRPATQLLVIEHSSVMTDPLIAAEKVNRFLGGGLDVAKMAAAIDPTLHRHRAGISS